VSDKDNVSIVVPDELLRTILIEWIGRSVGKDGALELSEEDASGFRRIRTLALSDVRHIAALASKNCIKVAIDRGEFLKAVDTAISDRERGDNLEFLLRNGATRSMIADVLGVSEDRVADAKARIGVAPGKRGRPTLPDLFVRQEIVERWHGMKNMSKVHRLRALHAHYEGAFDLASIAGAITEFVSNDSTNQSRKTA
jgi:Protein of unknown function (DUF2857)